jgi:hypothetical protein
LSVTGATFLAVRGRPEPLDEKAEISEAGVDGMVALVMAVGLAARSPRPEVFEPRLVVLTA